MATHKVQSCVIIGGGAAGLTAAVTLARTRRAITIIDAGKQSNKASHAAHNFFTRDGESPTSLYPIGEDQFSKYPSGTFIHAQVVNVEKKEDGNFVVFTDTKEEIETKTILLAQGVNYVLPPIPGLQEVSILVILHLRYYIHIDKSNIWGSKAWHCPFCHGYEARDQRILVIADAPKIPHLSGIIHTWSTNMIYAIAEDTLPKNIRKRIAKFGGKYSAPALKVVDYGDKLLVETENGEVECDSILVACDLQQRDDLHQKLGLEMQGNFIKVDEYMRTSVKGIYCAGDQHNMRTQVAIAAGAGNWAGIAVHLDLAHAEADE